MTDTNVAAAAASAGAADKSATEASASATQAEQWASKAMKAQEEIDRSAEKIETTKSVYEFAKLAITSLVTTSAGLLIALAALTGSLARVSVAAADSIKSATSLIGVALGLSLLSAISAYANQLLKSDDKDQKWGWLKAIFLVVAIGGAVLALLFLGLGGVAGRAGLGAALDAKTPAPVAQDTSGQDAGAASVASNSAISGQDTQAPSAPSQGATSVLKNKSQPNSN